MTSILQISVLVLVAQIIFSDVLRVSLRRDASRDLWQSSRDDGQNFKNTPEHFSENGPGTHGEFVTMNILPT